MLTFRYSRLKEYNTIHSIGTNTNTLVLPESHIRVLDSTFPIRYKL